MENSKLLTSTRMYIAVKIIQGFCSKYGPDTETKNAYYEQVLIPHAFMIADSMLKKEQVSTEEDPDAQQEKMIGAYCVDCVQNRPLPHYNKRCRLMLQVNDYVQSILYGQKQEYDNMLANKDKQIKELTRENLLSDTYIVLDRKDYDDGLEEIKSLKAENEELNMIVKNFTSEENKIDEEFNSLQSENTKFKELVGLYKEALEDIKGYWGACGEDCDHPSKLGLYEFTETTLAKGEDLKKDK